MTREAALDRLLTDVCTTGLHVLRNPRLPAARAAHRAAIDAAMTWRKAHPPERIPEPPQRPEAPIPEAADSGSPIPAYRLPYAD